MAWKSVPLGDVLVQSSNHKQIEPGQSYKQITVRLWGKGLVLRGICDGAEIAADRQIAAQTGDFIISKIDARHGAFGLVPAELNDALVSNDFPCFKINEEVLASDYLKWYSKTEAFVALCKQSSIGSTNRVRLKEGRFLELEIPLPSLDEQHAIARCLDSILDGVIEASNLADAALADLHALVFSLHESLSEPEKVSLGSLIELDERIETVEGDGEYPQLGIRSFGNGLFFKDAVSGAETSYKKFNTAYQGGLIVSQPKGWEGAIAVATADHEGWYLSPEYRTFRCNEAKLAPDYLAALIVTPWFQHALSKMTKGQGARRERLRPEMLSEFKLRMPKLAKQKQALRIIAKAQDVSKRLAMRRHEMSALLPALLHQIFEKECSASPASAGKTGNVVSLPVPSGPSEVDNRFKEAVLVAANIKAFHEEGGQPLGNFRLQKAVYFARRFLGETALEGEYLRKAAGPYNPTMRYSGGMKVALEKNWITPASGKYGSGHSPGAAIGEAQSWIDKYNFTQAAAWVRDKFKFKQNDIWELLATIDYAMLALSHQGRNPTSQAVRSYIDQDPKWHPKIAKLGLTEPAIQNAMVELESLFPAAKGAK